jgi:hypothetical protein
MWFHLTKISVVLDIKSTEDVLAELTKPKKSFLLDDSSKPFLGCKEQKRTSHSFAWNHKHLVLNLKDISYFFCVESGFFLRNLKRFCSKSFEVVSIERSFLYSVNAAKTSVKHNRKEVDAHRVNIRIRSPLRSWQTESYVITERYSIIAQLVIVMSNFSI